MDWSDEKLKERYATVDEVIAMLQRASDAGKGTYLVTCNQEYGEYMLARKGEAVQVNEATRCVKLGGYG